MIKEATTTPNIITSTTLSTVTRLINISAKSAIEKNVPQTTSKVGTSFAAKTASSTTTPTTTALPRTTTNTEPTSATTSTVEQNIKEYFSTSAPSTYKAISLNGNIAPNQGSSITQKPFGWSFIKLKTETGDKDEQSLTNTINNTADTSTVTWIHTVVTDNLLHNSSNNNKTKVFQILNNTSHGLQSHTKRFKKFHEVFWSKPEYVSNWSNIKENHMIDADTSYFKENQSYSYNLNGKQCCKEIQIFSVTRDAVSFPLLGKKIYSLIYCILKCFFNSLVS